MYFDIDEDEDYYNGAIEAATTLSGAVVVFLLPFINVNWGKWGNLAIVIMSGLTSVLLALMGITGHIWMAYIGKLPS